MSATTAQSVEEIRTSFPQPTLTAVSGEPSYTDITHIHTILKSNAASIPSTLGGGEHGLLGLVLSAATYFTVTGTAFAIPANPGATPIIPNAATTAQINALTRTFNQEFKVYAESKRADTALKQQILNAIEPLYIEALRNPHTGYTGVSTMTILTYLYTNYGSITSIDLDAHKTKMKQPYDINLPITTLFKQIEDGVEYAEAGNDPFTDTQVVNMAYVLLFNTGAYKDDCKDWTRRATAAKTWTHFKAFFATRFRERREILRLEQQGNVNTHFGNNTTAPSAASFHHTDSFQSMDEHPHAFANITSVDEVSSFASFQKETGDALQTLANATIENNQHFMNLSTENTSLRQQVTEMQTLLTSMYTTIQGRSRYPTPPRNTTPPPASYRDTLETAAPNTGRGRGRGGSSYRGGRGRGDRGHITPSTIQPNSRHYCHTHGLTRTPFHTSTNCRTPNLNHKTAATFDNRMNGSNKGCDATTQG